MAQEAAMQQLVEAMREARDFLSDVRAYAIDLKGLVQDVKTLATAGGVSVQNWPASVPVTGTFWPTTQPVSGTVSVGNLPNPLPTSVSNFPAPAYPSLTVQRAFGDLTASADIVAAQPAQKIRILAATLGTTAAVGAKFQSGTTDISATIRVGTAAAFLAPFTPHGWWETSADEALRLSFTGILTLSYHVLWSAA